MNGTLTWIGAQADSFEGDPQNLSPIVARQPGKRILASKVSIPEFSRANPDEPDVSISGLPAHQFPAATRTDLQNTDALDDGPGDVGQEAIATDEVESDLARQEAVRLDLLRQQELDREAELRKYRGRTQNMLRRYMRYSLEAGRLPSILGSEFFRTRVTSYSVVTFEDRVIFVHDMEICLEKMDDFSRQIIARYFLQGHSLHESAKLLHCDERTIRRNICVVLDDLSEILLKMGLMESLESNRENSCQGGKNDDFSASDC